MLALHVLSAPGLVLMFGALLHSHVLRRLGTRQAPNRVSGLLSLGTFATMAVTGYLLQVVTGETPLQVLVWLHVGSGGIFAVSYSVHVLVSVRPSWRALLGRARTDIA